MIPGPTQLPCRRKAGTQIIDGKIAVRLPRLPRRHTGEDYMTQALVSRFQSSQVQRRSESMNLAGNKFEGPRAFDARIQDLQISALGNRLGFRGNITAVIVAARRAKVMRAFQLAAIRAFLMRRNRERVVRATHIAARLRDFLLRNCHGRYLSLVTVPLPKRAVEPESATRYRKTP